MAVEQVGRVHGVPGAAQLVGEGDDAGASPSPVPTGAGSSLVTGPGPDGTIGTVPAGDCPPFRAEPFSLHLDAAVLDDLRARIRHARLPEPAPGQPWAQGTDRGWLEALLAYWADGFDWPGAERELNSFAQFRARVGDADLHFVHEKARAGQGIPLILGHGWPSCFAELLPLVPLLTDPAGHGIDGPAFDVVIPSLPGYGFSPRPDVAGGVTYRYVARLWHQLMRGLGYRAYGAGGGDFGAGIATFMALHDPGPLIGLHLTNLELSPYTGAGSRPLSQAEQQYLEQARQWDATERGYTAIQSTKPQTLGYALNDSPAGLAAWVLEKWRSWSDCDGRLESRFTRDFLLTIVTLYWATATITSSMRDYYDNRRWHGEPRLGPADVVRVPTAVAIFPHMLIPEGQPPREWAERLYDIRRWTIMPRGGHFAPAEEPSLVARDITAFYATLDR
jgi:pimeloyl-ACP methyl ester carboxylesterase